MSVASAEEARLAMTGGADIIDAKDPWSGALGAVDLDTFAAIHAAVGGDRPVSAALGDASESSAIEELAREYARRGASFVKIGFAGGVDARRAHDVVKRAASACTGTGVVAVAYADAASSVDARALIEIASRAGARGVLVDTADKGGRGLMEIWTSSELAAWVRLAHGHELFAAVAGKLAVGDLVVARDVGADIAGVRGAACVGGRTGSLSVERVQSLRAAVTTESALTAFQSMPAASAR